MTTQTKKDIRLTIAVLTGLLSVITFSFFLGTGFAANESSHKAIRKDAVMMSETMDKEMIRSKKADDSTRDDIGTIKTSIKVIEITMKQQAAAMDKMERKIK